MSLSVRPDRWNQTQTIVRCFEKPSIISTIWMMMVMTRFLNDEGFGPLFLERENEDLMMQIRWNNFLLVDSPRISLKQHNHHQHSSSFARSVRSFPTEFTTHRFLRREIARWECIYSSEWGTRELFNKRSRMADAGVFFSFQLFTDEADVDDDSDAGTLLVGSSLIKDWRFSKYSGMIGRSLCLPNGNSKRPRFFAARVSLYNVLVIHVGMIGSNKPVK